MKADVFSTHTARLGEGPVWDGQDLWWVDIRRGELLRTGMDHQTKTHVIGPVTGFAVPRENGGFVAGTTEGLGWFDPGRESFSPIGAPKLNPGVRFNDGKCDPRGRLWCGTMPDAETSPAGALYRMTPEGLTLQVPDVTISNGLGWSADASVMYYIDSALRRVDAFDYNINTGEIANRRTLFSVGEENIPDGMSVDAEGGLWIAFWGGWRVSRFDPKTGKETERVEVGARYSSSCCFGGPEMRTLFITSAGQKNQPDDPRGGMLFAVELPVRGLPVARYAG